ncbi:glutathione S-transferase, partial [Salmonella enterica subsp. enterica serovar Poona]
MCVSFHQVTAGERRYILGRNLIRPQEDIMSKPVIVLWSDANFFSPYV